MTYLIWKTGVKTFLLWQFPQSLWLWLKSVQESAWISFCFGVTALFKIELNIFLFFCPIQNSQNTIRFVTGHLFSDHIIFHLISLPFSQRRNFQRLSVPGDSMLFRHVMGQFWAHQQFSHLAEQMDYPNLPTVLCTATC